MCMQANIKYDPLTQKNLDQWLHGNYDSETKAEIQKMLLENPKEIVDAFYTTLSFGTGGLRGLMGIGPNRINNYTVRSAAQGLANSISRQTKPAEGFSVLIGYDCRHHSRSFAEEAAKVLAGNGIKVLIFKEMRPTPLVSFGCRYKKCSAAIMVTASHNPPQYNGFKVYWSDGGQVVAPYDTEIVSEASKIVDMTMVKSCPNLASPLISFVDNEIDNSYIEAISHLQNYREINQQQGNELKIVYTSLHGTGITLMPQMLARWGFSNYHPVEQQVIPDGNFPTALKPNPEERTALTLGIDELEKVEGDILIANDPDADRVGVAVRHAGKVKLINGNQLAALLLNHVCKALAERNKLAANAAFIKSIVTTELFAAICKYYQKPCFNVLPGFKYIAEKIHQWESGDRSEYQFVLGAEESFGYLYRTYTRDKDAIAISALICEMALRAKLQGKTLVDLLEDLFKQHGVYDDLLESISFDDSKAGKEAMARAMLLLRRAPPKKILDIDVISLEDYQLSIRSNFITHEIETLHQPQSDLLLFWLSDGSKLAVRPSGTEPKIKIYCSVIEQKSSSIAKALAQCQTKAKQLIDALRTRIQEFDPI